MSPSDAIRAVAALPTCWGSARLARDAAGPVALPGAQSYESPAHGNHLQIAGVSRAVGPACGYPVRARVRAPGLAPPPAPRLARDGRASARDGAG